MDDFKYIPDMAVVHAARNLIKTLCATYGTEQGMAAWDSIRAGLGDQIAADIFLGMLTRTTSISLQSVPNNRKIEAIKSLRMLTGFGLKESKDFVESVIQHGPRPIDIDQSTPERVETFLHDMQHIGAVIG